MARKFRHGDIVFTEVKSIPEGQVIKEEDKLEMHGETGKIHQMLGVRVVTVARKVTTIERPQVDWSWLGVIVPPGGTVITHPEHPDMRIPEGTFSVSRVRSVTAYID